MIPELMIALSVGAALFGVGLYEGDCILYGLNFLGCVIRNFAAEFLFKSHDQLNHGQGIGIEIFHEVGVLVDNRFVYHQCTYDYVFYALIDNGQTVISLLAQPYG